MAYQSFNPATGKLVKDFDELTDEQLEAKLAHERRVARRLLEDRIDQHRLAGLPVGEQMGEGRRAAIDEQAQVHGRVLSKTAPRARPPWAQRSKPMPADHVFLAGLRLRRRAGAKKRGHARMRCANGRAFV